MTDNTTILHDTQDDIRINGENGHIYNTPERDLEFEELGEESDINAPNKDHKNENKYGNFVVKDSGLYYKPDDNKEDNKEIWISSPIWPEAYLRDRGGKNHTLLVRIHDGERDHRIAIPRGLIAKPTDLINILLELGQDPPITPTNQRLLQRFLIEVKPKKKMRCVDKAGWHGQQYLLPDGEVIGESNEDEGAYPIHEVCPKGVEQRGTLEEWQDNVFKLCVGNSRLIFSVGVALAAPCLEIIGEEGGAFNIKGNSSIGKSKCLYVAISVFGSRDFKRSWRTTDNALEGTCALHNDCLLPLDEFGQVSPLKAGEITYMVAQGVGKERMGKQLVAREPKTWRVMMLSTGEVGIAEHMESGNKETKAGQMVRIADIPGAIMDAHGCFENIHDMGSGRAFADEIDRISREFYGVAGRTFIKSLVSEGKGSAKEHINNTIDDFVADYAKDCDGQVQRVARRFGLVYAALSLAIKFSVLKVNDLNFTDDLAKQAVVKCYLDWLGERGTRGDMESHNLIERVTGLLVENADGKFIEANNYTAEEKKLRPTLWGCREGSVFYVFCSVFKKVLCKGFNPADAQAILIEAHLLNPDYAGNQKKINGINTRCYAIDLNGIEYKC